MPRKMFLTLTGLLVLTTAVWAGEKGSMMEKGSMKGSHHEGMHAHMTMATARADIHGLEGGSDISGVVTFKEVEGGVKVMAQVSGVETSGNHGFHVHEYGSCADAGKAAGGHYNPKEVQHGYLPEDGPGQAHIGDMGNIEVDGQGNGSLEVTLPYVQITGPKGIAGRAVILHAQPDDFGQPTGNAGARIGCGTIILVGE